MTEAGGSGRASRLVLGIVVCLSGCTTRPRGPALDQAGSAPGVREAGAFRDTQARRERAEFEAALGCCDRGDFKGARQRLGALLTRNPEHRDGRLLLCDVCLSEGRPEEALLHANRLVGHYPEDPAVQQCAAAARAALARADARSEYRSARVVEDPTGREDPVGLRRVSYDEPSQRRREDGYADPIDSRVVAMSELETLSIEARDDSSALDRIRQAMAADPRSAQVPVSAATSALRLNRPDLAVTIAREALDRHPRCPALYRVLGVAFYRRGEYASSQAVLQKALALDPASALSHFLMGCTLAKTGQYEEAEACFAQARRFDPRFVSQP